MEVAFTNEIESLKLGQGQTFYGEGILAVTKALLQSGVSYVGGYQGAPVSHLLDVMVQAREYMDELGVHVQACTNEASAAAMLGASINYPVRGAVTWKSIVGTNVAADGLSNLSSPGVMGGALIIVGEDYGEGASVIQERTHAYALKSSIWLLDPRPDLNKIVDTVEHGFALSEASNTPVFMELRIRACHVRGSFECHDNRSPAVSTRSKLSAPAEFNYDRLAHPPVTFAHEKLKSEVRLPAAREYIKKHALNEIFSGDLDQVGIIVQGGLYNNLIRALQQLGLSDAFGNSRVPILCLNVVYPLVPETIESFCAERSVLMLEEGRPEYIEFEINTLLRQADIQSPFVGKSVTQASGELDTQAIMGGLLRFFQAQVDREPDLPDLPDSLRAQLTYPQAQAVVPEQENDTTSPAAQPSFPALPGRPPSFCIGCPERPVFSALKQVQEVLGPSHIAADIGCHAFATFPPFSMGNSILGYGMSLASAAGVTPLSSNRPIAVMGDGGFWHNGLLSGVASSLLNDGDGVLLIFKNGYTSATGTQELISSPALSARQAAQAQSATINESTIENTLKGLGVKWIRSVHTYHVGQMKKTLTDALTTPTGGLKVIVAEGECQLERQRRIKPLRARQLQRGERQVKKRFGIDENVCTGDHACVRLSGCPALTVKPPQNPLKHDPVATVTADCVGCGLCGENAHSATLCPSFYSVETINNPNWLDRLRAGVDTWAQRVFSTQSAGSSATRSAGLSTKQSAGLSTKQSAVSSTTRSAGSSIQQTATEVTR